MTSRSRKTSLVVFIASVLVFAAGSVALAKGPESVTMTGPGIESPIELMDAAEDWPVACGDQPCPPNPMRTLMEQTGLWYATGDLPSAVDAEPEGDLGPRHVLTWIRMGFPEETVEERTIQQFIYLEAEGGPYIHTPAQLGLQDWGGGVIGWFEAPDGLAGTLDELGVPISEAGSIQSASQDFPNFLGLILIPLAGLALLVVWFTRRDSRVPTSA